MAITSVRRIVNQFTEAEDLENLYSALEATNDASPGQAQIIALSSGANTITKPTGATGCTIIPPAGNAVTLTLKGVTGDTGVSLHLTDPTSLGLGSALTTFCLTAGGTVTVRFIWS